MKNQKTLCMILFLSVSIASLPVYAADKAPTVQPSTPAPAIIVNSIDGQRLANIEKHLEYIASDVRFKWRIWYLELGVIATLPIVLAVSLSRR
jgi:hypothetical protein